MIDVGPIDMAIAYMPKDAPVPVVDGVKLRRTILKSIPTPQANTNMDQYFSLAVDVAIHTYRQKRDVREHQ